MARGLSFFTTTFLTIHQNHDTQDLAAMSLEPFDGHQGGASRRHDILHHDHPGMFGELAFNPDLAPVGSSVTFLQSI